MLISSSGFVHSFVGATFICIAVSYVHGMWSHDTFHPINMPVAHFRCIGKINMEQHKYLLKYICVSKYFDYHNNCGSIYLQTYIHIKKVVKTYYKHIHIKKVAQTFWKGSNNWGELTVSSPDSVTFVTHLSFPCHGSRPFEVQWIKEQLFLFLSCDRTQVKCSTNS